jgi:hypothetical protein
MWPVVSETMLDHQGQDGGTSNALIPYVNLKVPASACGAIVLLSLPVAMCLLVGCLYVPERTSNVEHTDTAEIFHFDSKEDVPVRLLEHEYVDQYGLSVTEQYYVGGNGRKVLHGRRVTRDTKGRVSGEEYYEHGLQSGIQTYFFDDGRPASQTTYVNGVEHGVRLQWSEESVLTNLTSYYQGTKHGWEFEWSHNGYLMTECHFKNGRLDGVLTV